MNDHRNRTNPSSELRFIQPNSRSSSSSNRSNGYTTLFEKPPHFTNEVPDNLFDDQTDEN